MEALRGKMTVFYIGPFALTAQPSQFWGPLTSWKFEPFPRPVHTLTPSSINTQNRSKNYMVLAWHALISKLQVKTVWHWKAGIWLPVAFKKKSRHTHQNPLKPSPVSERSAYPLQNYVCFSPLTSGLESFGHKSTPSHRPWIEAYCPKF